MRGRLHLRLCGPHNRTSVAENPADVTLYVYVTHKVASAGDRSADVPLYALRRAKRPASLTRRSSPNGRAENLPPSLDAGTGGGAGHRHRGAGASTSRRRSPGPTARSAGRAGTGPGMPALFSLLSLLAVADNPGEDSGGLGIGIILVTLLLVVIAIAAVWTFVAKRGSRTPGREPHDRDHVGH